MSEYRADLVESVRSLAGTMLRSEIAKKLRIGESTVCNIAWRHHFSLACTYKPWSEQDIATLKTMRKSGFTFTSIAKTLDRSAESCKQKFYATNEKSQQDRHINAIRVINNMAGDYTAHEIGEKLHITAGRVQWLASKYKISLRMKDDLKRPWSIDEDGILLLMYKDGATKQEIADRLNRTVTAVYARYSRLKNDCTL